jgi:Ferritin-like domain
VAAHPTRRVVLAAAVTLPLAAVSGCGGADVLATPPRPAADVDLLRSAIAAEQLMIARYGAVTGGATAAVSSALEPLLAEHRAHLAQLRSRLIVPAGSPTPSPRAPAPPAGVPSAPGAALAYLRDAEQAAAAALLGRLPHAPASLAQLLASISASEATHVPVLGRMAAR